MLLTVVDGKKNVLLDSHCLHSIQRWVLQDYTLVDCPMAKENEVACCLVVQGKQAPRILQTFSKAMKACVWITDGDLNAGQGLHS